MNKPLLESFMKRHGDTGTSLAEYLGISRGTFSSKLNEYKGYDFTQEEIILIKERYKLTPEELDAVFFSRNVS